MILELKHTHQHIRQALMEAVIASGTTCHAVPDSDLLVINNETHPDVLKPFQEAIGQVISIDTPYQLASKQLKPHTRFNVSGIDFDESHFNIIAGPCSVENEDQMNRTASFLASKGVRLLRGGAFKPRTSPYSFRGLGKEGLKLIHDVARANNQLVVTEILDLELLDDVYAYADILQVGSRNMQNFHLLNALGNIRKPVLLKRGMQAKAREWLLAAEYILCGGNDQVILCERGIRSFDPETRNVMDLGIIPLIHELSHLPVIADPSHGTGAASRVIPIALAAAAAGADGLIVEIHPEPAKALSDAKQALSFDQFSDLLQRINPVLTAIGKPETSASFLKLHSL